MGGGVIIGRGWPSSWSLLRYDTFDRPLGAAPRGDWGRGPSQSNVTLGLLFTPHVFLLISFIMGRPPFGSRLVLVSVGVPEDYAQLLLLLNVSAARFRAPLVAAANRYK